MIERRKRFQLKKGLIGVISDTHGVVRPEALAALNGSELIIHAGDIGKLEVLDALESIAPVAAIRGNNDCGSWALRLPDLLKLEINGFEIHVVHAATDLSVDRISDGVRAVISGHSHKPKIFRMSGVLYLNPGSAGPRRFSLPVAVGKVRLREKSIQARICELQI